MTAFLDVYMEEPSDLLAIACRAQHIQRWKIARKDYPEGKAGYLTWRNDLKLFHAKTTAELMRKHGYFESDVLQVENMLLKNNLEHNRAVQAVEDVACLVFLKYHFEDFILKFEQAKAILITQKTWKKMSVKGQGLALELLHSLPNKSVRIIELALS